MTAVLAAVLLAVATLGCGLVMDGFRRPHFGHFWAGLILLVIAFWVTLILLLGVLLFGPAAT